MMKIFLVCFFVILLVTGCNFPLTDVNNNKSETEQKLQLTQQQSLTLTASVNQELLGSTPRYEDCYWNWATKSLSEETKQLQAAINKEGFSNVIGIAEAYGENCIDPATNQVARFAVMETDFRFTVEVEDLSDTQAMGDVIFQIIGVIKSFPEDAFPGAHPGYVGIRFRANGMDQNAWFILENGENAISDGKRGSELYFILSNRN